MRNLGKHIGWLKERLNNLAFVASAPEGVVIEVRGNLDACEGEASKLHADMAGLAEIGRPLLQRGLSAHRSCATANPVGHPHDGQAI